MNGTMYALPQADYILCHFSSRVLAMRDGADFKNPRLDAAVRSNEYFTTLATALETIATDIEIGNPALAQALDNIVYDLEYLQRQYAIVPKGNTFRSYP